MPVINENDVLAVPERRKLFSDNDSLAQLLAVELKADLLLLLSDVNGVYARKPEEGEVMHPLPVLTRATPVSFGGKSTRGRGGMESKVESALSAVDQGVGAVVIASGFAQDSIRRIVCGEQLGTVFLSAASSTALAASPAAAAAAAASVLPAVFLLASEERSAKRTPTSQSGSAPSRFIFAVACAYPRHAYVNSPLGVSAAAAWLSAAAVFSSASSPVRSAPRRPKQYGASPRAFISDVNHRIPVHELAGAAGVFGAESPDIASNTSWPVVDRFILRAWCRAGSHA